MNTVKEKGKGKGEIIERDRVGVKESKEPPKWLKERAKSIKLKDPQTRLELYKLWLAIYLLLAMLIIVSVFLSFRITNLEYQLSSINHTQQTNRQTDIFLSTTPNHNSNFTINLTTIRPIISRPIPNPPDY